MALEMELKNAYLEGRTDERKEIEARLKEAIGKAYEHGFEDAKNQALKLALKYQP